jgi:hypothetical protein
MGLCAPLVLAALLSLGLVAGSTWTSLLSTGNVLYTSANAPPAGTDTASCNYLQFAITNNGTATAIAYAGLAATGDIIIHASQPSVMALGSVAGGGVV